MSPVHGLQMPAELSPPSDTAALLFGRNAQLIAIDQQIEVAEQALTTLRATRVVMAREVTRLLHRYYDERRD